MAYFNIISQTMSTMFVRGIAEVAELLVSIKRIQQFLMNDEFHNASITTNNHLEKYKSPTAIRLDEVTAKWNPAASDNTLENVSFNLPHGHLLGVIGPVGSGKSSLLQTVLGKISIL